jgi:hypothetical protein
VQNITPTYLFHFDWSHYSLFIMLDLFLFTHSAFLRVGTIDRTWHPFSIASDPKNNCVEFYIEVFSGGLEEQLWRGLKNEDQQSNFSVE